MVFIFFIVVYSSYVNNVINFDNYVSFILEKLDDFFLDIYNAN